MRDNSQTTIWITKEARQQLRILAALQDTSMKEVLERLIREAFEEEEKKKRENK